VNAEGSKSRGTEQSARGRDDGPPEISFCIVNTNGRELLLRSLESIFRHPPKVSFDVVVLDNASDDGSAEAVKKAYGERVELIERSRRHGFAENASELTARSSGRYCLQLNEDEELMEGAADALWHALEANSRAAAAGAKLFDSDGQPRQSAWRFPTPATALAFLLFLAQRLVVQSRGEVTREVDWVECAGMLIRRSAWHEVGAMDPAYFLYSDEVDWQKRARDAGWSVLYVPDSRIVHREQLAHGAGARRRIVEYSRNRDLYIRKHHGPLAAFTVRALYAPGYLLRAVAAVFLPDRSPGRYLMNAYYSAFPGRGEGLREAAEQHNRRIVPNS
jgi:N-acetylglucosaminyl-diphospho-decaprenol L-rhamnosyltransferase